MVFLDDFVVLGRGDCWAVLDDGGAGVDECLVARGVGGGVGAGGDFAFQQGGLLFRGFEGGWG